MWKGEENGDPYLHSIHFAFALGAFVAPIIAEPFLCNKESSMEIGNSLHTISQELRFHQNSSIENSQCFENEYSIPGMFILYPIVGVLSLLASFGYLVYGIKHIQIEIRSGIFPIYPTRHQLKII